jgi:hypothetical protein
MLIRVNALTSAGIIFAAPRRAHLRRALSLPNGQSEVLIFGTGLTSR